MPSNLNHIIYFLLYFVISASEFDNYKCLIHNVEYPFEYLIASKDKIFDLKDRKVFTVPLSYVKKYEITEWKIISIIDDDTVYLKNVYANKYLCATNKHLTSIKDRNEKIEDKKRRLLNVVDEKDVNEKCEWRLEKLESKSTESKKNNKNNYRFWNIYYNQPMYAISKFLNGRNIIRGVYLWHKKPDSNQFSWFIDCKTGLFLIE